MKRFAPVILFTSVLLSCNFVTQTLGLGGAPTPAILTLTEEPALAPGEPTRTPHPTAAPLTLALEKIPAPPEDCDESPFGLPAEKLAEVAYVPSGYCFNGEIDLFETGGHLYVVQSLGDEAAFFITDVTDPSRPFIVGEWQWNAATYTADVKSFHQGERNYIVLSLEPVFSPVCGVAIVEVSDPANPGLLEIYSGRNTASPVEKWGGLSSPPQRAFQPAATTWCDAHTTEISADENGDGAFVYVSSIDTNDLRVLDIRDLARVREINHYTHPDAGFQGSGEENFVHDTTLVGDRVYVAYWSAGVVVLDRRQVESGEEVTPLNPPGSIAPEGLQVHHSFPTADGNFLFVEDEVNYDPPQSQLRLYDIRDLSAPEEVTPIALDDPYSSPHNLLVSGDLLFVGWYSDGVRVFQYDTSDPANPTVKPYAFKAVRPEKTVGVFGSDLYDGVYGVRLHDCEILGQPLRCVYASDLTRGLLILAMEK